MTLSGSLSGAAIREKFIRFFADKHGHKAMPSASLIPVNPTVLLTPAGMSPFVPIFLGVEPPPDPPRLVSVQKCARVSGKASDLEYVGRTPRHHTFFEMLGNFSFGDYFKEDAIAWAWEFVTLELSLPVERLWITVYEHDDEARQIWHRVAGIPLEKIIKRGAKDNFWGLSGPTGPCGPCSEIFYDRGGEPSGAPDANPDLLDTDRFVEIWNLVFMELFKDDAGQTTPLDHKNVDTGMGLERITLVMQQKDNTFETDLLYPLVDAVAKAAGLSYKQSESVDVALKIVADHIRCICFAVADGIVPSNEGRGYILRMLLRRAFRYGRKVLGFREPFLYKLVAVVRNHYQNPYAELAAHYDHIVDTVKLEEKRFLETLERGSGKLEEILAGLRREGRQTVSGEDAFRLYDTYGFPVELTRDIAQEAGCDVDMDGFEKAMDDQRDKARKARGKGHAPVKDRLYGELFERLGATRFVGYETLTSPATVRALVVDGVEVDEVGGVNQMFEAVLDVTPFYAESGGQAGDRGAFSREEGPHGLTIVVNDTVKVGELVLHRCLFDNGGSLRVGETVLAQVEPLARQQAAIHHTATHLLQGALRRVLGDTVTQAGSHVSAEGARFDFTFHRALAADEINRVEFLINKWIRENTPAAIDSMPIDEARQSGAILMAGEQYGDVVRVITYGDASKELCGGTHAARLGDIGLVKIVSEGAIASGIRRIELIAGEKAYKHFKQMEGDWRELAELLKSPAREVPEKVKRLVEDLRQRDKRLNELEDTLAGQEVRDLARTLSETGGVLVRHLHGADGARLKRIAEGLVKSPEANVIVLAGDADGKAVFVAAVSDIFVRRGVKAGDLVKLAATHCGGGGGGKPNFAQAGGKDASAIPDALAAVSHTLQQAAVVSDPR